MPQFEVLGVLCGLSFANFAVESFCSKPKSKDSNRKGRKEKAAKDAKNFKLRRRRPARVIDCGNPETYD
jgi:hypothetical protein